MSTSIQIIMNTRELIGNQLYDVFNNSGTCMCLYNTKEDSIISINPTMKAHSSENFEGSVKVIQISEKSRYVTIDEVPCKLTFLVKIDDDISLMTMALAHTKKWGQKSDLVSLTDITSDGVWEWFPELKFEYMSERFWNILGYDQKDMDETPMSWMGFLNPEDKDIALKMCGDHISSHGEVPYIMQARYKHKNGHEVIVLCRGSVVDWMPDGKPWRLLGTHTDITDVVKKDSVEAKTKFISRMSHEIRSPVCTILNECDLLGDTKNTKVIKDTCIQLISITDDILSINTMKKEGMVMSPKRESLEGIISRCTKRHRIAGKKQGIKIRSTVDELPGSVMVDVGKFNQVLDNLIGNSLKYSNSGSITLDVEYDNDTCICSVRVSDEGIGMDPSFHTSAFEELVQGDDTAVGAGIGLTLCRRLAELMDGNVTIEKSSLGNGTTMLFQSYLPECDEDIEERISRENSIKESTFKVLIVDDINTNLIILRRRLDSMVTMGLRITTIVEAVNGKDAVDKFSYHKGDFQLVLMDCHMPILDGFDSTVQIHGLCSALGIEAVPVVAVTASVSTDIYDKCLSVGMKYVVTKPYSELDLMASIQSCIKASI